MTSWPIRRSKPGNIAAGSPLCWRRRSPCPRLGSRAAGRGLKRWRSRGARTPTRPPWSRTSSWRRPAIAAKWAAENDLDVADVRTRSQWDELRAWAKQRHEDEVYRISLDVAEICARRAEVDRWIAESRSPALLATLADVKEQMANLVPSGFVSRTPAARLPHIERYIRAAYIRIQKAATNPSGDDALAWQIQDVNDKVEAAQAAAASRAYDPSAAAALDEARWMVEELRVSLFAQQLGTNGKVSAKRIAKVLARA